MDKKEIKYSGIGIATFIISILSLVLVVWAALNNMDKWFFNEFQTNNQIVFINICFFVGTILSPIGTGLGIAAVLEKDRRKALAIIGLIINGLLTIVQLYMFITTI